MSLITRCPACETMFKVVPDQLRISDGWVRCGQCDEIFDASANLMPETSGPTAGPPTDAAGHWALAKAAETRDAGVGLANGQPPAHPAAPGPSESALPEPKTQAAAPVNPIQSEAVQPTDALVEQEDRVGRRMADQDPSFAEAPPGEALRLADLAPGRASFLHEDGEGRSIWRRTWVRAALGVSCLVLLLSLGAQVVYVERDRIAALEPALRPWLISLCELQGCAISPMQRIDAIVIDSSSFNKLRGDVYRLNFTVRSTAPIEVGLPAVELTLTDSQDQVLTRRVFSGAELGAKTSVLAPGSEWQGSWAVSVKGPGITDHISGYRLLAFYP